MRCSQLLFGTVSLGVVVLLYLTTSAKCAKFDAQEINEELQTNDSDKLIAEGYRHENDLCLFNATLMRQKSTTLPKILKEVMYPPRSDDGDYILTYVVVDDKGKGGQLNLTSGGMGCPYVIFKLAAKEGEEYEFHVSVYGFKYD